MVDELTFNKLDNKMYTPLVASVKKGNEIDFANRCEEIIKNGYIAGLELKYFQAFAPNTNFYGNNWFGIIVMIPKPDAQTEKGK